MLVLEVELLFPRQVKKENYYYHYELESTLSVIKLP